jgi:hypothetical protein
MDPSVRRAYADSVGADEDNLERMVAEGLERRLLEEGCSPDFARMVARAFARARQDRMVIAETPDGIGIGVTRSEPRDPPATPPVGRLNGPKR